MLQKRGIDMSFEDAAQSLCTSCGLCCNGSLFKHAKIFPDDDGALLESLHLDTISKGDRRFFVLPCPQLAGCKCKVYDRVRPRVCSAFRCELLKRFYRGECSFGEAQEVIHNTVAHCEDVRRKLSLNNDSHSKSLLLLYDEWQNADSASDGAVELLFYSLQHRLQRDFLKREEVADAF